MTAIALDPHVRQEVHLNADLPVAFAFLMMLTGGFAQFSYWLLENVPFLSRLG